MLAGPAEVAPYSMVVGPRPEAGVHPARARARWVGGPSSPVVPAARLATGASLVAEGIVSRRSLVVVRRRDNQGVTEAVPPRTRCGAGGRASGAALPCQGLSQSEGRVGLVKKIRGI